MVRCHALLKTHLQYRCSEYWGDKSKYGDVVGGVRNEDLQMLCFADGRFDTVLSSDVFEHVPDPYRAHREIFRVLKSGGRHIFTVPYGEAMLCGDVRASLVDGKVVYPPRRFITATPCDLARVFLSRRSSGWRCWCG